MEIVLVVIVVGLLGYWMIQAHLDKKEQELKADLAAVKSPYKVETPQPVVESAPYQVPEPAATPPIPLVVEPTVEVKAKKAPAAKKAVAKPKAPPKPKKTPAK